MDAQTLADILSCSADDIPMFHDASPHHTHQMCNQCLHMQRSHKQQLSSCKACGLAMYCSRQCQVAHWPMHKTECKNYQNQRESVEKLSGLKSAFTDLSAWKRYHDAAVKNCAIAALNLRENPHLERTASFCVSLHHTGDLSVPPHKRFILRNVSLLSHDQLIHRRMVYTMLALKGYPAICERGRVELGARYYGSIRVAILASYGPDASKPTATTERLVHFSINKELAKARVVTRDWAALLGEYVRLGARMRFCCGKITEAQDICCCGGWIHDEEKVKEFHNVEETGKRR
ncbi:hypothetical protein R3P38DRAFT_69123 [Favolaschia claudopus]|uniref:MYND-type domain-containing protein n=1 Tax=Favolaschia claudopus TaxID=2862362 RepID=A0AAW0D657_9AGAR